MLLSCPREYPAQVHAQQGAKLMQTSRSGQLAVLVSHSADSSTNGQMSYAVVVLETAVATQGVQAASIHRLSHQAVRAFPELL